MKSGKKPAIHWSLFQIAMYADQDCAVSGDASHSLLRRILLTTAPQVDESATHDADEEECLSEVRPPPEGIPFDY